MATRAPVHGVRRGFLRRFSLSPVLLLALLALGACATLAPDVSHQDTLGRVAIVAVDQAPEFGFEGFARGAGEGAARGAGGAFGGCLSGAGGGCSGQFCGAALIILLGICGIAGIIGGIAGAATAPAADAVSELESRLAILADVRTVQESLRSAVEAAALAAGANVVVLAPEQRHVGVRENSYVHLANQRIDTVLETTLVKAGTSGYGVDSPAMAYMQVRVRLVDSASGKERFEADYLHEGRRRGFAEWSANQGKALIDELGDGYVRLGAHIYENVFSLYPFPDRSPHSAGGLMSAAFGLAPVYPPTRGTFTGDTTYLGGVFEWFAVDELRPRIRWEAFPRRGDVAQQPEAMARVTDVRYELIVAREENMAPGDVVFRRDGIAVPETSLDDSLRPDSRYFWTVRARFDLDGRTRVTEWGSTRFDARDRITAPSRYSYRFRTTK